jgi:DNA-directed RNA polymerase subunit RPC12/RpoP
MNITEQRKSWHNAEAELSKADLCTACNKGVLVLKISFDRDTDESYPYAECSLCGHTES